MNANECRREGDNIVTQITRALDHGASPSPIEAVGGQARALWEIAAQLSELNDMLRANTDGKRGVTVVIRSWPDALAVCGTGADEAIRVKDGR